MTTLPFASERGASPASVIMILVVVMMFAELIVLGGRVAAAYGDVTVAAREAARQGSLAQYAASVNPIAEETVKANLEDGRHCRTPSVSTLGTNFDHGGQVKVTVTCTVDVGDLSILAVPWPSKTFTAEATEIVETYRAVE